MRSGKANDDDDDDEGFKGFNPIGQQTMERRESLFGGSFEKGNTLRKSSTIKNLRRGTKGLFGHSEGGGNLQENYLTPEEMKDFDKVLSKIEEVDEKQRKWEEDEEFQQEQMEKFKYENQYINLRVSE